MCTERLPDYQNAQGVIWPIFNMERTTGTNVHKIDDSIDTGPILIRESLPISFRKALRETVVATVDTVCSRVPALVLQACENWDELNAAARPQSAGRRYTTPSLFAFLTMLRNNARLYEEEAREARSESGDSLPPLNTVPVARPAADP